MVPKISGHIDWHKVIKAINHKTPCDALIVYGKGVLLGTIVTLSLLVK